VPDVQVAVGLGWKASDDTAAIFSGLSIGHHDFSNEIAARLAVGGRGGNWLHF
jgi:hypothetical protein